MLTSHPYCRYLLSDSAVWVCEHLPFSLLVANDRFRWRRALPSSGHTSRVAAVPRRATAHRRGMCRCGHGRLAGCFICLLKVTSKKETWDTFSSVNSGTLPKQLYSSVASLSALLRRKDALPAYLVQRFFSIFRNFMWVIQNAVGPHVCSTSWNHADQEYHSDAISITLFEYDQRFEKKYPMEYVPYDYRHPLAVPEALKG